MASSRLLQSFYASKPWRELRLRLIMERGNKCQRCGKVIVNTIEIIGHHKVELDDKNVLDHMISLNPDLIELICFDCHNDDHDRFNGGVKTPKPKGVYLVYGPPLSGKSSYVVANMTPGDLVVDMDSLYEAISYQPKYIKPDKLLANVIDVQRLLLDHIKTRHGTWRSAWIVGGFADKYRREMTIKETGATPVFIETSKDECLMRLEMLRDERMKHKKEWEIYINRWFERYQP